MNSNMEYRQSLTNNASLIMKNNQTNIRCSTNFLSLHSNNLFQTPILFNSVIDNPLPHNSDLKSNYLDNFIQIAKMFTPGIMYNN